MHREREGAIDLRQVIRELQATLEADGRANLHEHEGYRLIQSAGMADVPRHVFVPHGTTISPELLAVIPSDRVVLKIVSPQITHKTDFGGVIFADRSPSAVLAGMTSLKAAAQQAACRAAGTLLCECIEAESDALGRELFVGLRASREFGMVVTAGLGGTATEALADAIKTGLAVATAGVMHLSPEEFLAIFKGTLAYGMISGGVRGRGRIVEDQTLLRCFQALFALGREAAQTDVPDGHTLEEFEINPLRVAQGRLVALDAVARWGPPVRPRPPRPVAKVAHLLKPRSIAVVGVSSRSTNMARIILGNLRTGGFDPGRLFVVKAGESEIDGVRCVPGFAELPEKVDLVVIAVAAAQVPACVREIIAADAAEAAIIIPAGMGETAAGAEAEREILEVIVAGRRTPSGGPVFLGGNCMGVQSRPGRFDTFFIPSGKWDARLDAPPRRLAFISQSGGFLISRLSNVGCLDPAYAVTVGNQIDLSIADVLEFLVDDPNIDTYAVYIEGLPNLEGSRLAGIVRTIADRGKTVVVYRAGRTPAGRSATAGHTSVLAGDYAVCAAVLSQAGALVADTFRQFERLVELSTVLHGKRLTGRRIGLITNAGYEAVGMADALTGSAHRLDLGAVSAEGLARMHTALQSAHLDAMVNAGNPLDLTPMAGEEAYEDCTRLMLAEACIDALVVSIVPLTPKLPTTAEELACGGSLVARLAGLAQASSKPVIVAIDSGRPYDALADRFRGEGLAVFRSADEAVASLGRYVEHRLRRHDTPRRP